MKTAGTILIYVLINSNAYCNDIVETSSRKPIQSCGLDKSPITVVYEGVGRIETYPWLGTLYYPLRGKRYTTAVVLITKQIVLGSAIDIDKLPKSDFRSRSRVVLGSNCSGPSIGVKEYSFHPAYSKTTYSAVVLVQLDTTQRRLELRPICPPPAVWNKPQIYAMTLSDGCHSSKIRIYKMGHVSPEKCRSYYNKTGLDVDSMWPTHTVCARALHGQECVWRNGAVLTLRQGGRWSLIGFGISGPGCRAPARFLDYGLNHFWVKQSIARIGRPAITRIARNEIVMRRTTTALQRYGRCDREEIKEELFTDSTSVTVTPKIELRRIKYNFTLIANMEYSCIVFKVEHQWPSQREVPLIRLRRWCTSPRPICYSFQYLQIDFLVEIFFVGDMSYHVAAYGEEAKMIDMKKIMVYTNQKRPLPRTKYESKKKGKGDKGGKNSRRQYEEFLETNDWKTPY